MKLLILAFFCISVAQESVEVNTDQLLISLKKNSFGLTILDKTTSSVLLSTSNSKNQLAFGQWTGAYFPIYNGYEFRSGKVASWFTAEKMLSSTKFRDGITATYALLGSSPPLSVNVSIFDLRPRQFTLRLQVNAGHESLKPADYAFPMISAAFSIVDQGSTQLERFYGFGQRWGASEFRGQLVYSWTEDGAWEFLDTSFRVPVANATYAPMPWMLSSRGYGVLADTSYRTEFDLGHADAREWAFRAETNLVDLVFFMGRQGTNDAFTSFNLRRGNTLIPSPWVFGPWKQLSSSIPNVSDIEIAKKLISADVPTTVAIGALHFFPTGDQRGREQQVARENKEFHDYGLRSLAYFNPYVSSNYQPLFNTLVQRGFFLKNSSGLPYLFEYFGDIISRHFFIGSVDFTNPNATAWYQDEMRSAIALGFDGWMYDFGEYTPVDSFAFNKQNGRELHNEYPAIYDKACYDLFAKLAPDHPSSTQKLLSACSDCEFNAAQYTPDMTFYARSGYTNSGLYSTTHWTGDAGADWSAMSGLPAHVEACLSMGISGVPYCGSQIGGYVCELYPAVSPELLIRWAQLGALSGTMQDETQGSECKGRAQLFTNQDTIYGWRKFAKLRTALFPYIYTAAHEAFATGLPITRHHILVFPNDTQACAQRYQFMFGPDLLVAPVVEKGKTTQNVYLPRGADWYDLSSPCAYDGGTPPQPSGDGRWRIGRSQLYQGGQSIAVNAPLHVSPIFVRAGTITPLLDPSVYTLNAATVPGVVSIFDRQDLLHLWVWPNRNTQASTTVWDSAKFEWKLCGTGANVCFSGSDRLNRILFVQIPVAKPGPQTVTSLRMHTPVSKSASWQDLVRITPRPTTSAWVFDNEQSVLWLRVVSIDLSAGLQAVFGGL